MRAGPVSLATLALASLGAMSAGCSRVTSTSSTSVSSTGVAARVSTEPALPSGVTSAMVERGRAAFNEGACIRCHGAAGIGGDNGPSLVAGPWLQHSGSYDEIVATITNGVPASAIRDSRRRLAMRPRGGPMQLTDEGVRDVAAYVWSISRGKR